MTSEVLEYLAGKVWRLHHDDGLEDLVRHKERAILLSIDLLCPATQQLTASMGLVAGHARASSEEGIAMRPKQRSSVPLRVLIAHCWPADKVCEYTHL